MRGKCSVQKLASLQQVANVRMWLYFTGYLEVERSDLVEVSCRLGSEHARSTPFSFDGNGKDTSTPSVSKYRYCAYLNAKTTVGHPENLLFTLK